MSKTCPQCRTTKPAAKFHADRASPDGLQSICKGCRNGATARNEQYAKDSQEPAWGDPTEEDIRRMCQEIRMRWSDKDRQRARERATRIGGAA